MKNLFLFLISLSLFPLQSTFSQQVTPFKNGDRVAMVGNSITDGGHYHSYIWLYYMTHFPNQRIDVFNCGIGGDTAYDICKRLDGDVFSKRPNVITLTFGMNDSGYYEHNGDQAQAFADRKVAESKVSYVKIEERLKTLSGTNIVMIGGSPYDETTKFNNNVFHGKNKTMDRMVEFQKKSAQDNGWQFVDFGVPMTEMNLLHQKSDSTFTLCGTDRIHPDNDGHMVMAYLFLKAQGMDTHCVADISINAKKGIVEKSDNCVTDNLKINRAQISFDYLANSLPYPLDTIARGWGSKHSQAESLKIIPFTQTMNREMLRVTDLRGEYEVSIDNEVIGKFSSKELESGVNLACFPWTPQYQQALKIMLLNEDRWEIERKFRDYAWIQFGFFQQHGKLFNNDKQALALYDKESEKNGWLRAKRGLYNHAIHTEIREAWQNEMDMLVSMIYDMNTPQKHRITLKSIK